MTEEEEEEEKRIRQDPRYQEMITKAIDEAIEEHNHPTGKSMTLEEFIKWMKSL